MAMRPEQTQLAFDNAVEYGLDGFETDVRLTKDEQLIVFHDALVDRTTNGSGKVSEHTLAELKRLDADIILLISIIKPLIAGMIKLRFYHSRNCLNCTLICISMWI